jgi:hypothetical protein
MPLHPENKIAFILYEDYYPEPIDVSPALCVIKKTGGTTPLSFVPCTDNLVTSAFFSDAQKYALFDSTQSLINPFIDFAKPSRKNYESVINNLAPKAALFPLFVSMNHQKTCSDLAPSVHHFARVTTHNEIHGQETPFFGLLRFFRDAFLDTSHRASKNVFLFDQLVGFNDFSLFANLFAETHKGFSPPCGTIFLTSSNTTVSLEHVIVVTQGCLGKDSNKMEISISFTLDGFSWHYNFFGTPQEIATKNPWCFIRRGMPNYTLHYRQCVAAESDNYTYKIKIFGDVMKKQP